MRFCGLLIVCLLLCTSANSQNTMNWIPAGGTSPLPYGAAYSGIPIGSAGPGNIARDRAGFRKQVETADAGKRPTIADRGKWVRWEYAYYIADETNKYWRWLGPGQACSSFETEAELWRKAGMFADSTVDPKEAIQLDFLNFIGLQGWELVQSSALGDVHLRTFKRDASRSR